MSDEFFEKQSIPLFNEKAVFVENQEVLEQEFSEAVNQNMGMTSGVFVLNKFRQFLLTKRSESDSSNPGLWDFPSGSIHTGESPKQAAMRELKEEAGLEIEKLFFLHSLDFTVNSGKIYRAFRFVGYCDETPKLSSEHSEYQWANYKETQELLHHQDFKNSIHLTIQKIYPNFALNQSFVDYSLPLGERGIAIIQIKETGEFVVYDKAFRGDIRIRFPGGHVDPGENALEATVREVEEEVGLVNLEYIKHLGSSQSFYNWAPDKNKIIYKLDHTYFFRVSIDGWNARKPGIEKDIKCFLTTKDYILQNSNDQQKWLMGQIVNY